MLNKGLIHVYCGQGKGKTTCAVGLCVRASGYNKKIVFAQFLKTNNSGEVEVLKTLPNVSVLKNPQNVQFYINITEQEKLDAKKLWHDYFLNATDMAIDDDMLILDEILGAVECGFLDENELIDYLKSRPLTLEVVLTGRNVSENVVSIADYVSKIDCVAHPYNKGIQARKAIEY